VSVDLRSRYLGLELANPMVPSASPLTGKLDSLKRLEDAGASAAVVVSLFEEQIEHDELDMHRLLESTTDAHLEARSYFPELDDYRLGPEDYLEHIRAAKEALSIPLIGSLNGASEGGWIRYAKLIEEAGADALELNIYLVAADPEDTADVVEARYVSLVKRVCDSVSIPVAVKIAPYFSSLPNMAVRLVEAGVGGLVLFNRFMQPDINLDTLAVDPIVRISTSDDLRLPLRWIAILKGRVDASLAGTTGVHSGDDAVKMILAGADAVMMASALLHNGPERLTEVLTGVERWLEEREYESVEQAKGSVSQRNVSDPGAFERANYAKALTSFSTPQIWNP
jgi:dihydroorotate dehydrogenase (fumarate)